jgi:hypothetical protein
MKHSLLVHAFLAIAIVFSASAAQTNATPAEAEAKYTAAIEGRTADILKVLGLADTNKSSKVHAIIMDQYRALKAWHEENDAKLKAAKGDTNGTLQIRASLKVLHEKFLSSLADELSHDQIEAVKDKMTYGKVQFTFASYMSAYPNLAEEHQQKIIELLKQAREEAMDGGSAEEKTAVFQRYKGKINNYLSKQGVHPEKKTKFAQSETNTATK